MRRNIRSLFAVLMLLSVISAFTPVARAQDQGIDPWADPDNPGGEQIDRRTGQLKAKSSPDLPEQIQLMSRRMTGLMEFLQSEVVAYTSAWAMQMAQLLSGLILLFSFLRIWRENGGKGQNLYWWFVRLGVCLGLLGSSVYLVDEMIGVGKDIAVGPSMNSVVFKFYDRMQANFTESYALIAQNNFKVKVPGEKEPFAVKPVDSADMFLGVLYDRQGTARDFNNNLKDSAWSLPRLYAWLGACRGILEGGDLWLMILSGVLLIAVKIFAPITVALAIDQKLASRISYPFLWGVIVLTLIWPVVSYFIRGLAYMFGNVAMALGDSAPVYVWNDATMQAFRNASSQPVYTVAFACFTMTVSALCLWLSPVIAYQISVGRIYEGVSNAASTFAGAVVGTAIELYSSISAARLNQEAAQIQANAGYESESARVRGEQESTRLSIQGRQYREVAGVKAGQIEKLAELYARQGNQITGLKSGAQQQNDLARAGQFNLRRNEFASEGREGWDNSINWNQQQEGILAGLVSGSYSSGGSALSQAAGKASVAGAALGAGLPIIGSIFGGAQQIDANNQAMDSRGNNIGRYHYQIRENSKNYLNGVKLDDGRMVEKGVFQINDEYAGKMEGATGEYTQRAAGAINSGASIQRDGINRGAEMERQAAGVRYDAQIEAACINLGAAIEGARLHAMESVIRTLGGKIARDIEGGMVLRY